MLHNKVHQSSLFRHEVTASLSHQWMGSIRLTQRTTSWLASGLALGISAAFLAFILMGNITKKAHVTGVLIPVKGTISVNASGAGVLIRNAVKEGEHVHTGQTLFELSTERNGSNGELSFLIAQQLAAKEHSLQEAQRIRITQYHDKTTALKQRLQGLDAEKGQLEEEIELAKRRIDLAQQSLSKFENLAKVGYVSLAQAQQKQEELIDLDARLKNLRRTHVELSASRQDVEAELTAQASSLKGDLAQIQQSRASLRQEVAENNNHKSFLITAPQDGVLTTIIYQPGQAIAAGQVLATLIPGQVDAPASTPEMEVQLFAPSRAAGFIAVNQTVLLRYHAFPYQKFGLQKGTVTDVSRTPLAPGELPQNLASTILSNAQQSLLGFNSNESLYRIRVRPEKQQIDVYGHSQALKPGMTLEADILQERRKIWEWVAEPLLAMRSY
jgi:membrane fusion protein